MSTIWELPLTPQKAQRMRVDLGGTMYMLHFRFNRVSNTWMMEVNDANDAPLVHGIPLVTGTDLFGQLRYLGIGGGLPMVVMTIAVGRSPDEIPTWENLGLDGHVYFRTLTP
jgi:hypothetical protein